MDRKLFCPSKYLLCEITHHLRNSASLLLDICHHHGIAACPRPRTLPWSNFWRQLRLAPLPWSPGCYGDQVLISSTSLLLSGPEDVPPASLGHICEQKKRQRENLDRDSGCPSLLLSPSVGTLHAFLQQGHPSCRIIFGQRLIQL